MTTFNQPQSYAPAQVPLNVYQPQVRLLPQIPPPPSIPTASAGQILTGDVGLWVNGVLGYSYELTRDGQPFQTGPWPSSPLYELQQSDLGSVIQLIIIATNRSGAGPVAKSRPILVSGTLPVPGNLTLPTIVPVAGDGALVPVNLSLPMILDTPINLTPPIIS